MRKVSLQKSLLVRLPMRQQTLPLLQQMQDQPLMESCLVRMAVREICVVCLLSNT